MIESQVLARAYAHGRSPRALQMVHMRAQRPKRPSLWCRMRAAFRAFTTPKEPCCS